VTVKLLADRSASLILVSSEGEGETGVLLGLKKGDRSEGRFPATLFALILIQ